VSYFLCNFPSLFLIITYSISKSACSTSYFLHHFRLSPSSLARLFSLISFSLIPISFFPSHRLFSHFLLHPFLVHPFFFLIPLSRSLKYHSLLPHFCLAHFPFYPCTSLQRSSFCLFPHPIISFPLMPPPLLFLSQSLFFFITLFFPSFLFYSCLPHSCLPHPLPTYFPSP
jgi:hypothetical protein